MDKIIDEEIASSIIKLLIEPRIRVSGDGYNTSHHGINDKSIDFSVRQSKEPKQRWHYDDYRRVLTIFQSDNLENEYLVQIYPNLCRVTVVYKSGKQQIYSMNDLKNTVDFIVKFTFDNPISEIRYDYKFDLRPSYIVIVEYSLADAEKINNEKMEAMKEAAKIEEQKNLRKKMNAEDCSNNDLINIYFENANDQVVKTEVVLYRNNRLLGTFLPNPGCFFVSIKDLVPGTYEYEVVQYDKSNNVIVSSERKTTNILDKNDNVYIHRR